MRLTPFKTIGDAGFNKSINDFSRALSTLLRNSPDVAEAIGSLAGAVNFLTGFATGIRRHNGFAADLSSKIVGAAKLRYNRSQTRLQKCLFVAKLKTQTSR